MSIEFDLESQHPSITDSVFIPESAASTFLDPHFCAKLQWRNINYKVGEKQILEDVTGEVHPGEVSHCFYT